MWSEREIVVGISFAAACAVGSAQPFISEDFDPAPDGGTQIIPGTLAGTVLTFEPFGHPGNCAQLVVDSTDPTYGETLDFTFWTQGWDSSVRGTIGAVSMSAEVWGEPLPPGTEFAPDATFAIRAIDDNGAWYMPDLSYLNNLTFSDAWTIASLPELMELDFMLISGSGPENPMFSDGTWRFNITFTVHHPPGVPRWGGRYRFDNLEVAVVVDEPEPVPGPTVVMYEPSRAPDDVLRGGDPISTVRILFSHPVVFGVDDLVVRTDGGGDLTPIVSGSGSSLMSIVLPAPVAEDTLRVTLLPTIVAAVGGAPIDGDGNGEGGDAGELVLEHRGVTDLNGDRVSDVFDLLEFLSMWFAAGA